MGGIWSSSSLEDIDMDGPVAHQVKEIIDSNPIVIFSKGYCPYCTKAKKVFDNLGQTYKEVDLVNDPNASEIQNIMQLMTGARTVPRVFVNGKCIGGGSETQDMYNSGELQALLALQKI